jgi:hypothetical protein
MIPGGNLLNMALSVISPQVVTYHAFVTRTKNAAGLYVSTFAAPVDIVGSVQAVPREKYEAMGLDYSKNYVMLYTSSTIRGVERDRASDQFIYSGKRYEIQSVTNWQEQDGWNGALGIEI